MDLLPHPGRHLPERWKSLLTRLIDWAGYEPADQDDPLIRKVGWTTRESPAEIEDWRQSPDEDIQYYLSRNPDYSAGYGLTWIAPISPIEPADDRARVFLAHALFR